MVAFYFALAFAGEQLQQLKQSEHRADHAAWTTYRVHYGLPAQAARHRVEYLSWRGYRLVGQRFMPREKPRGTVHLVHGYLDHTGLQWPIIKALNDAGYVVRSIDLPGHGLSQGPRAHINAMDHYTEVLGLWLEGQARPLRFVAHSMGGAVVMQAMRQQMLAPSDRVVLIAPLVRWSSWWLTAFAQRAFGWMLRSLNRRVQPTSSDEAYVKLRRNDPLLITRIPLSWPRAMRHWANHFVNQTGLSHRPIILQGRRDKIVDWRANHALIEQIFPAARFHFFKRGRHHLQGESPQIRKKALRMLIEGIQGGP